MSRNGKIARLPGPIRAQINQRLDNGDNGRDVIDWLNSLEEVKRVLAEHFAGLPITDCNLSEWRQGGYRDWKAQEAALAEARLIVTEGGELAGVGEKNKSLAENLAVWLTGRLMMAARRLIECEDEEEGWKLLRALCHEVAVLRRGDCGAHWLRLEEERMRQLRKRDARDRRKARREENPPLPALSKEETDERFRQLFGMKPS